MDEDARIVKVSARCRVCGTVFESGFLKNRLRVTSTDHICPKCSERKLEIVPRPRRPAVRSPNGGPSAHHPARSA